MSDIHWRPYYPGREDGCYVCPCCELPLPAGKRDLCDRQSCDVGKLQYSIRQKVAREHAEFAEKRAADYRKLHAEHGESMPKYTYAEARGDEAAYIAWSIRSKFGKEVAR